MSILIGVAAAFAGAVVGQYLVAWLPHRFPKYPPGTPVQFDGDSYGIYVCRTAWPDYHRVKVTGPSWLSAARERREVTVHGRKDQLVARVDSSLS